MPHVQEPDDDENEDFDPEGPDPSEMDYSDDPDLEVCPHCRKMIVEDAERCPHCGEYISAEDAPISRGAWFLIIVIGLLLLAFLFFRL
jgi:hypothetical protein